MVKWFHNSFQNGFLVIFGQCFDPMFTEMHVSDPIVRVTLSNHYWNCMMDLFDPSNHLRCFLRRSCIHPISLFVKFFLHGKICFMREQDFSMQVISVLHQKTFAFFFPIFFKAAVNTCPVRRLKAPNPKSYLIIQLMDFCVIFISRATIFCFRSGIHRILNLMTWGVGTVRGRPDRGRSLTSPVSSNSFMHR